MKQKFVLFWWRVWHHRNDTIFAEGKAEISHSARFLQNYLGNLRLISDGTSEIYRKGKSPMVKLPSVQQHDNTRETRWQKPELGWAKVNVDGSFLEKSRSRVWDAVIRDHDGRIILSAWDYIPRCNGADCEEAMACLKRLRKAMSGTDLPVIVETDCRLVTKVLILSSIDRSEVGGITKEFQAIKGNTEVRVLKVDRRDNRLLHSLVWA
ncbi:hypothetical protein VPH35_083708 [Triticum aestivum]|uniref:RNase H type-1 domain-containing protein n=1 Tax=Triticum turgidum subsp. durum TaxID=4567 RepID=A0A9R0TR41_TRITD|nr:unnamed protein product [Triticum turgidum subsp. durum]